MEENKRDSTIIYRSFYEAIKELPKINQSEVWEAVFEYSLNFKEIELKGLAKTIFILIKPQIEANNKRFVNGSKAKQKQNASETEANYKQDVSKTEANNNVNKNNNNNVNHNYNFDFCRADFLPLLNKWISYIQTVKKQYFVQVQVESFYKNLFSFSNGNLKQAEKIVDKSISGGYTNIYEPENKNEPPKQKLAR